MKKTLSHNGYSAVINYRGAELVSLKSPDGKEFIWNGNPEFWGKHSPVLFPFVGTLKNDTYSYKGNQYQLGRHGFAREMDFSLTHHSESQAVFSLQFSEETLGKYPFKFWLQINYRLLNNTLLVGYSIINEGNSRMPFALGAHPAFALDGKFTDFSLQFEKEDALKAYLLEGDLLSDKSKNIALKDKKLKLDYDLFKNDALIIKNVASKNLNIVKKDKRIIKVEFDDFPHLGLWTKPEAPFICIEPWFGYSDKADASGDIYEKESVTWLEAGAVFNTNITISVF